MAHSVNNIIYGGDPIHNEAKEFGSLAEYILNKLKKAGDKVILVDGFKKLEYTGRQVFEETILFAKKLKILNIKPGDVVGVSSENRFELAVSILGTLCANAILAPYNITYTERELSHAVDLSRPKILIASPLSIDTVLKISKKYSFIQQIIVFDKKSTVKHVIPYEQFINDARRNSIEYTCESVDPKEAVALILCSSGTTGLAKGVQITQNNVMTIIGRKKFQMFESLTLFSIIPWFHSFGCLTLLLLMTSNLKFVFIPKFDEKIFLSTIQNYKIQVAFLVPPLLVFLAKHPLVEKYDLSSLLIILSGAAPLSKEVTEAVKKRISVMSIWQGYGLSETTLGVIVQNEQFNKPGSVGTLQDGLYAKVVDTETGEALGPYKRGELCFKGEVIMKGYIGDKKATNEAIDNEGWLHSGDIGYYDTDFEFFIVDRIKELIKYKAYQVPPAEIEALLLTHRKIRDAGVVGLPDEACGELPLAFIVKQPNVSLDEKEIIDFVAKNTSPMKWLRGGVRFVDAIPKNPSGKILRRQMKEMINIPKSKL